MGIKDKRVNCPVCNRRMTQKTFDKYEGQCHICDRKEKGSFVKRHTLAPDKLTPISAGDLEEEFNLWELKEEHEKKKQYLNQNPRLGMKLYLRWFMANPKVRKPSTKKEVARCLDCTITRLDSWSISKEWRELYDEMSVDKAHVEFSHKIRMSTGKAAAEGNKDMIKLWYDKIENVKKPEMKKKFGKDDEKFLKEIKKRRKTPKNPMGGTSLKKKEKEIAEKLREADE